MNQLFEPILDDDEVIVSTFKPNKLKMFFSSLMITILVLIGSCGLSILGILVPGEDPDTGEIILPPDPIFVLIPIGIFILVLLISIFFVSLSYKKRIYAITNKRVLIRAGVIGVDFKSLDMAMIGAIDVYVSFIDRLLGKNTGSIRFGSTSSPMNSQNASQYCFNHIIDPYKNCKEIKAKIDQYKQSKLEK